MKRELFLLLTIGVLCCAGCSNSRKESEATMKYWKGMKDALSQLEEQPSKENSTPEEAELAMERIVNQFTQASDRITALPLTDVDPEVVELGSELTEWLDNTRLVLRDLKLHVAKTNQFNVDANSFWVTFSESLTTFNEGLMFGLTFGEKGDLSKPSKSEAIRDEIMVERERLFDRLREMEAKHVTLKKKMSIQRAELTKKYGMEFPSLETSLPAAQDDKDGARD